MNKDQYIAITGIGSISPLGCSAQEVWRTYQAKESLIKPKYFNGEDIPVASLSDESENILNAIRLADSRYRHLDKTVIMAVHCARAAVREAGWKDDGTDFGINVGSSRGATELLEKYHAAYLGNPLHHLPPLTSPTTTLGNISSWVARDLGSSGPEISHSVTCSTALHAVFNGVAWLTAGFADRFLVGAAEAPLTGFTVAQMKALRIYTSDVDVRYPSRPCISESPLHDTMALGEGGALFALERLTRDEPHGGRESVLGIIESFGYSQERLSTPTSITEEGKALQESMAMALRNMRSKDPVDMVILHAPGTVKGDRSELNAVRAVFGRDMPILVSNKWIIGHTLGASGALSLQYALLIMANDDFVDFPYPVVFENKRRTVHKIMINAAGFGGNAASLVVSNQIG